MNLKQKQYALKRIDTIERAKKKRSKVVNEANKIRDQIMLGDSEKALALIEKYEAAS